jgi:hypothetical protein
MPRKFRSRPIIAFERKRKKTPKHPRPSRPPFGVTPSRRVLIVDRRSSGEETPFVEARRPGGRRIAHIAPRRTRRQSTYPAAGRGPPALLDGSVLGGGGTSALRPQCQQPHLLQPPGQICSGKHHPQLSVHRPRDQPPHLLQPPGQLPLVSKIEIFPPPTISHSTVRPTLPPTTNRPTFPNPTISPSTVRPTSPPTTTRPTFSQFIDEQV